MRKSFFALILALSLYCYGQDKFVYYSLDDYPVYGAVMSHTDECAHARYARMPDSLQSKLREDLWGLGQHSAGLAVRFRSDASAIKAKWKSLNKFSMNHMTPVGIRGLDLYALAPDSTWTFVGSARPSLSSHNSASLIMEDMEPQMREYMLYLSLYDGVDSLQIGVDSLATVLPASIDLPVREKPIVMYGTSILQGGCANRPGMAHTSIIGRELNREVINLGFSGNARLDLEIADMMAAVDAGLYVLDMLPNCTIDQLRERIGPFYERLRASRPGTPILFVENPQFPSMRFNRDQKAKVDEKNAFLKSWYSALNDPNVYYFVSEDVLKGNVEATVDNAHLTDLGFAIFAQSMLPAVRAILAK